MISKSPDRGTFQLTNYLTRCEQDNKEPDQTYLNYWRNYMIECEKNYNDLEWQKNNLEYDLRSTDWILNKVRASDEYAHQLYATLCNNEFLKKEIWPILKDETWSCSWRYAGGIIADMREVGDYIDWYCGGDEGRVFEEIETDINALGWIVVNT